MASLDTAIRLVTQAVQQDTAKNYEEAARCYREAVIIFKTVSRSKGVSKKVKKAIEEKTALYEARLRKLDRHLLGKADLTNLFREVVSQQLVDQERKRQRNSDGETSSNASSVEEEETTDSVDSAVLYENPFLKKGLETIGRAKAEDAKCHFPEAIHFYEQGAGALLDAVRRNRVPERQADTIRIKCLLIHDRCELIRNHLEHGAPLKVRKGYLDSFESSLEGSPDSGSPLPYSEEDHCLNMEDVRSQTVSVAGSTHSLYPMCVEIKRSPSVMSGQSDFPGQASVSTPLATTQEETEPVLIPLADLKSELNISALSLTSRISTVNENSSAVPSTSNDRSLVNSVENLVLVQQQQQPVEVVQVQQVVEVQQHASPMTAGGSGTGSRAHSRVSRLLESDMDGILVVDENGRLTDLSFGEQDRNVTELTYMNSELDSEALKDYLHQQQAQGGGGGGGDSGSDSGFSDPSPEGTLQNKSPASKSPSSDRKSPLSDISSLDIVPSMPLSASPSPSGQRTPVLLVRRSRANSSRKSSGSSKVVEDDLQVLSEEMVVDGKLLPKRVVTPEVYSKASARPRRDEYIPPRSVAMRQRQNAAGPQDGDEGMNKGCYYFMACLDSFWIL